MKNADLNFKISQIFNLCQYQSGYELNFNISKYGKIYPDQYYLKARGSFFACLASMKVLSIAEQPLFYVMKISCRATMLQLWRSAIGQVHYISMWKDFGVFGLYFFVGAYEVLKYHITVDFFDITVILWSNFCVNIVTIILSIRNCIVTSMLPTIFYSYYRHTVQKIVKYWISPYRTSPPISLFLFYLGCSKTCSNGEG